MRIVNKIRFFFVVIIFFASLLLSMAGVHTAIKIPKGTIKGRLANGLSYIIKRNAHPRNTTEFRLVMRIGALQQTDAQGGTAHFLEHMAFAGSKSYHGFSMVHALEGKGMKFILTLIPALIKRYIVFLFQRSLIRQKKHVKY